MDLNDDIAYWEQIRMRWEAELRDYPETTLLTKKKINGLTRRINRMMSLREEVDALRKDTKKFIDEFFS